MTFGPLSMGILKCPQYVEAHFSVITCTFQNEDIFKIVDFIPKLLLTNDGIAKQIIEKHL